MGPRWGKGDLGDKPDGPGSETLTSRILAFSSPIPTVGKRVGPRWNLTLPS